MIRYLFDTNILLLYLRDDAKAKKLDQNIAPLETIHRQIISAVTLGELRSLSLRNNWGIHRSSKLQKLLSQFIVVNINAEDIIQRYAEIDTFSQDKLKNKPLGMSARNMGKNDIWIAATASVIEARLITADKDFDHLDKHFLELIKVV